MKVFSRRKDDPREAWEQNAEDGKESLVIPPCDLWQPDEAQNSDSPADAKPEIVSSRNLNKKREFIFESLHGYRSAVLDFHRRKGRVRHHNFGRRDGFPSCKAPIWLTRSNKARRFRTGVSDRLGF